MWWKCILLTVFWLALARPGECSPIDLNEAIQQLQSWQAKIQTIRVISQTTTIGPSFTPDRKPGDSNGVQQSDWIWDRSGRSRDAARMLIGGRVQSRTYRIANRLELIDITYPKGSAWNDTPTEVLIQPKTGNSAVGDFYWLRPIWFHNMWLGDQLAELQKSGKVNVTVTEDGLLMIRQIYESLVLDPNHGYLPRQIYGVIVNEYREIEPGFWFPWKGEYNHVYDDKEFVKSADVHLQWEIKQVDLNTELPDALFEFPVGNGTHVVNSITKERYIHVQVGEKLIKKPDPAVFIPPTEVFLNGLKGWPGLFAVLVFGGMTVLICVQRRRARLAAPVTQDVDDNDEP